MKKSSGVLSVVVILALAYTAGSWYVGQQAQKAIEQSVEQANQRVVKILGPDFSGTGLKIVISDYRRHVFSSDVVYTLQMKDAAGQSHEFILSDHLQHGPFPAGALAAGDFAPLLAYSKARMVPSAATQKWFDSLNGDSPVQVITKIGFSGSGQSTWQFKPLDVTDDGDTFKFSGGTVQASFSNDFENSVTTGKFESFSLTSAENEDHLQFSGVTFNNNTQTGTDKKVRVQSSAMVDNLAVTSGGGAKILVEKMAAKLDSVQNDNLLDGSLHYDFGSIKVADADLGSISVAGKASRLDVSALGALTQTYDAIKTSHGVTDDDVLDLTEAESALLREKILAVLASDPTIAIDPIIWKNDKGESTLALTVNLSGPQDKDAAAQAALDKFLPQVLKLVSFNASISKPMFVKAFGQLQQGAAPSGQAGDLGAMVFDQYAAKLAQAGLVKVEGDKASAVIKYENNSIEANGQKMSVAEFFQRSIVLIM